jgi:5'-methylthioadenosine phosphorylase
VTEPRADIGVFGGSGFYAFLDDVEQVEVDTPFGAPSGPIAIGSLGDRRVAFLPRHGPGHRLPPHRVPYRANVRAMLDLGVRALLGPYAAGSLQTHIHPGEFVVCDQLVDRTWGRPDTFFDVFDDGPHHVSLADPYDTGLRAALVAGARTLGIEVHDGGTVVVVQGPRFSTRAESHWYRAQGWEVINMTQYPEAALARELDLPYAGVALITDYDTGLEGVEGIEPVTQEQVFGFFEANVGRVRDLLFEVIPRL